MPSAFDFPLAEPATDFPTAERAADFPTAEPATDFPTAEPATDFPTADPAADLHFEEPASPPAAAAYGLAATDQAADEPPAVPRDDDARRTAQGWLSALNAEQREAATYGAFDARGRFRSGPLLVIAGAGTGKTATLAHRVAHLVLQGVDPARILLLTFTRRAAQEMTSRAERIVAHALHDRQRKADPGRQAIPSAPSTTLPAVRLTWAGTFHAIGARLLRQHATRLGLDPSFGILDRADSADLLDTVRHQLGLSSKERRFPRKETCLAIYSHRVNTGGSLERVLDETFPWCAEWSADLRTLFRQYVERKQENGVLDYDDLLLWWRAAMDDADFAADVGSRFDHVLVDEYQDTNALQAQILLAMKPDGAGLMVVGDDAQSIYGFRAADVGNILDFPGRFDPPAHRVTLEHNYRSVQPVLDAANALLREARRQYPKTLRARRGHGALPRLVTLEDERAQSDYVADEVLRQREAGVLLKRQAVLFRSSHHSDLLEVELARRNIPFVKYGGLKFLEAAHVKDLLALLRWADNPRNGVAAFRVLQLMTAMGPSNAQRCIDHVRAAGHSFAALGGFTPPAASRVEWEGFVALMATIAAPDAPWSGQVDLVRRWYRPLLERRYDDAAVRDTDLEMLGTVATQFGSRERFLTELTLDPPAASGDLAGDAGKDEDYLVLSTVHSAKGQEWDSVFVLNVADGNFPNEYATGREESVEEERRLFYVALTRARDTLQLLEPLRHHVTQQARHGDRHVHGARSRFLTAPVLRCFERPAPPGPNATPGKAPRDSGKAVDVAAAMRRMW